MALNAGIFVTGTDTGVGKTRVASWILRELAERGLRVGASKPVASGAEMVNGTPVWRDAMELQAACPLQPELDLVTPIRLMEPLAPPTAARRSGRTLTLADYQSAIARWNGHCDFLVVEGVGGVLCPITDQQTVLDLAVWWDQPALIVANVGLGTINHTLLTVQAARRAGLALLGVVLNQPQCRAPTLADETNPAELRRWLDIPVWGPIEYQDSRAPVPPAIGDVCDALEKDARD